MKSIIEEIIKNSPDPLGVRKTTAKVVNNSKFVKINPEKIKDLAMTVAEKLDNKQVLDEEQFGSMEPTPQLIFVLDAINFCFWAKKDEEKWTVEYPKGNYISNGWYALVASIERARSEDLPILDSNYLKDLKLEEVEYIFRSSNKTPIPLLNERLKDLNSIGKILSDKYDGNIYNFLSQTDLEVGIIAPEIVKNFPSFEDFSELKGQRVNFYKRAQIFAYDIGMLQNLKVKHLKALTAFADYKVPQMLRAFEILEYSKELSGKVDNYKILSKDSREEVEIRANTVWACELIAKEAKIEPVLVDNVLWKMSQSLKDVKPYHRVLTTSY